MRGTQIKARRPEPLEDEGKKIGGNLGCVRGGNTVWRAEMAFSVPCCRSLNRKIYLLNGRQTAS
jgi:hypothetical protein